jgi:NADH-quinone oxidoreductase subunit M
MLIAFVYLYQQAGSFLLEDLYKLIYQQLNNYGYSWPFFLAYILKFHLFRSILGKQVQKAPAVGTMLLSGLC